MDDDKYRLKVKILSDTKVADIEKNADDIRRYLKLEMLEVVKERNAVYIIIAKKRSPDENKLINIWCSSDYTDARKTTGLAYPFAVDQLGDPVIIDFLDNRTTHILVCGTTNSGKTTSLMCLLTTMVSLYSPQKVNLIIGDYVNDLSQFKDLPHLSYPIIEDFDTLLCVLLMLKDEMKRRTKLKNTEEYGKLPIIVCVIDEFTSFMSETDDKSKIELAKTTLSLLLQMGRHARIHFVLAAHDPTKENMRIKLSDIPVKMVFQVSTLNNSTTALSKGGAENLKGNGDMLFKAYGSIQHLQGAYISKDEVEGILNGVRTEYRRKSSNWLSTHSSAYSPRGRYGFTISGEDLENKVVEIQNEKQHYLPENSNHLRTKSKNDQKFAAVIVWALNQDAISANMIVDNFGGTWRKANDFMTQLQEFGVVEELEAKLRRKVLLHSVEELPQDAIDLLQRNGLCDSLGANNSQPVKVSDAKENRMMNPAEFERDTIATKVPNDTEVGQVPIEENVDETTIVRGKTKSNHSGELSLLETKRTINNIAEHLKHHSDRYKYGNRKFKSNKFKKGDAH